MNGGTIDPGVIVSLGLWTLVGSVLITLLVMRARMHTDKVLQSLAEKGLPVPPELLRKPDPRTLRTSRIERGVVLIAVGAACILFFWAMTSGHFGQRLENSLFLPFLGAFPLFVGVAYLYLGLTQHSDG